MNEGQTRPIPIHMVLRDTTQVYEYKKLVASEVIPILGRSLLSSRNHYKGHVLTIVMK